jgi:hypothetical protein
VDMPRAPGPDNPLEVVMGKVIDIIAVTYVIDGRRVLTSKAIKQIKNQPPPTDAA